MLVRLARLVVYCEFQILSLPLLWKEKGKEMSLWLYGLLCGLALWMIAERDNTAAIVSLFLSVLNLLVSYME